MKQKKLQIGLPLLLSVTMVAGMVLGYKLRQDTAGANSFLKNGRNAAVSQVLGIINKNYVDNVNTDSLQSSAINNVLAQLDPYSVYISTNQVKLLNDETKGSFTGIGIEFELISDSVYITGVTPNAPAYKAGVRVGDVFVSLNDSLIISGGNRVKAGVVSLLNELGNTIRVKIYRAGQTFSVNITKALLPISSVDAAYMLDSKTAYIRLNKFSETTYREFMLALEKLKAQGMRQLIIDLRGNGGGVLMSAVQIANEFLRADQLIVYTDGAKAGKKEYRCLRDGFYPDLKLEVLIDETTASASEVLAGALQDWDRATIIGRRSFGKGLVEEQFKLTNGAALRLTVARYFTPLGRNIQKPYHKNARNDSPQLATRFYNGETVLADTSAPKGKAFKTLKGNTVYGGGGITPDIYVPYDTTILPKPVADLFLKGTLTKFAFLYYMQHPNLQTQKTPETLANYVKADNTAWQQLTAFAQKDSVQLSDISEKAKANIVEKFAAFVGKERFGADGYFEINNQNDELLKQALDAINR